MSRTLIAIMLVAVALGGPAEVAHQLTWPDHAVPTSRARETNVTALAHRTRPDDIGEQPASRFGWPLAGSPTVVQAFRPPAWRYGPGHRGVDLASAAGAPVLAAGVGTVVFAGTVAGHGVVSVDHQGGLRTTYEPVSPTVNAGDRVARGQRIGTVQPGHLGCPVTVCLHWGVLRSPGHGEAGDDRQYLDPLRLLGGARVRLLPIEFDRLRSGGSPLLSESRPNAGASTGGRFLHLSPEP
ncbi:MAG: M23 family metallopeptidase [Pseudonocardiaceae bacterium]